MLTKKGGTGIVSAAYLFFCVAPEVETVCSCRFCIMILSDRDIRNNEKTSFTVSIDSGTLKYCINKCLALLSVLSSYFCRPCNICVYFLHSLLSYFALFSQLAVCMGTPILTPSWILKAWEKREDM